MGNENPSFGSCKGEDLRIAESAKLPWGGAEIDSGLSAENSLHNIVIEVRIGEETDFHFRVAGGCWRASSSFW